MSLISDGKKQMINMMDGNMSSNFETKAKQYKILKSPVRSTDKWKATHAKTTFASPTSIDQYQNGKKVVFSSINELNSRLGEKSLFRRVFLQKQSEFKRNQRSSNSSVKQSLKDLFAGGRQSLPASHINSANISLDNASGRAMNKTSHGFNV